MPLEAPVITTTLCSTFDMEFSSRFAVLGFA